MQKRKTLNMKLGGQGKAWGSDVQLSLRERVRALNMTER